MSARDPGRSRRRVMASAFVVSTIASIALCVVYAVGGQPQAEGALLGVSLGGIAIGLILWGRELMPGDPYVEEREELPYQAEEFEEAEESLERGLQPIERRSFLAKLLGGAVAALGVVALFPIRSLGTRPGNSLFETNWGPGKRLVDLEGVPIKPEDLDVDGVLTVFPEGSTDEADSQTLLIRFPSEEAGLLPHADDGWTPEGFVAFSKICTHAGCPVGLYQATTHELFCPCHQSVFAVLDGAEPTGGPATRPLPQLPLAVDEEGYLVSQSDYREPVGPGFWRRGDAE
ncbi:MAG: Rieske 2Fe-2S domain-containing protein [Actinomycetota bacterium]